MPLLPRPLLATCLAFLDFSEQAKSQLVCREFGKSVFQVWASLQRIHAGCHHNRAASQLPDSDGDDNHASSAQNESGSNADIPHVIINAPHANSAAAVSAAASSTSATSADHDASDDVDPALPVWRLPLCITHMAALREAHLPSCSWLETLGSADVLLALLARSCPRLAVVNLARVPSVSDAGIAALAIGAAATSGALQLVDLTFCARVSYGAVLALRGVSISAHALQPEAVASDASPSMPLLSESLVAFQPRSLIVRRLPAWLCGHFTCPWGETHTYWPCGAFSFSRAVESEGWVHRLRERADNCVVDRLQYINAQYPPWLLQMQAMHPELFSAGVLLRRDNDSLGDIDYDSDPSIFSVDGQVLVVQSAVQLAPPARFPPAHVFASLGVGQSMDAIVPIPNHAMGDDAGDDQAPNEVGDPDVAAQSEPMMISRMAVRRLGATDLYASTGTAALQSDAAAVLVGSSTNASGGSSGVSPWLLPPDALFRRLRDGFYRDHRQLYSI